MSDAVQQWPPIVGPASFLRPQQKPPPPEPVDIVDKEQAEGLVSNSEMRVRRE